MDIYYENFGYAEASQKLGLAVSMSRSREKPNLNIGHKNHDCIRLATTA